MPVLQYPLRKFSYNRIPDEKLVEGRISIPFFLQFSNTGDEVALPFSALAGIVTQIDARTVANVQNFSSFKSVTFTAEFQSVTPDGYGTLFFYSADSGDLHEINPQAQVDPTASAGDVVVIGCLPIFSNQSFIQIAASLTEDAGDLVTVRGNLNNFELPAYLYSDGLSST